MSYFNYKKIADEAKIPKEKLIQLSNIIREEFPTDDMMYELHLLRACKAIKKGRITIDRAIQAEKAA